MSQKNNKKVIKITNRVPGYAHIRWEGTCSDNVTIEDIIEKFYDSKFGGRNPHISKDGTFSVIEYTD